MLKVSNIRRRVAQRQGFPNRSHWWNILKLGKSFWKSVHDCKHIIAVRYISKQSEIMQHGRPCYEAQGDHGVGSKEKQSFSSKTSDMTRLSISISHLLNVEGPPQLPVDLCAFLDNPRAIAQRHSVNEPQVHSWCDDRAACHMERQSSDVTSRECPVRRTL